MGGTTTRGRKKAAAVEAEQTEPVEAVVHNNELQAHVEQLMASLTAAKEERTVFEAEM